MKPLLALLACAALSLGPAAGAWAHGGSTNTQAATKEQKPWGIAGDEAAALRTIHVRMGDHMRFSPRQITVREGETVRFVVRNGGEQLHEMVIGTKEALEEHAALMTRFPQMEHDEPHMAHVAPSRRGQIVWNFNRPGEFQFACLVPGHHQAGMVGTITVRPANSKSSP